MYKKLRGLSFILFASLLLTSCVSSKVADTKTTPKMSSTPSPQVIQVAPPSSDTPLQPTTPQKTIQQSLPTVSKVATISRTEKTGLDHRPEVLTFANQVAAKHNLDRNWILEILSYTKIQPRIIEAMDRPAESKIWGEYRPIFITEKRINDGVNFYKTYEQELQAAYQQYGISPEVIVAIIGVETSYGSNRGSWAVLDALATLSFDYPRRAAYFTKELENFFVILNRTQLEPFSYLGSYAGAMGFPQFMPSSYLAYAVDFDGDNLPDLWNNPVDAIGSVANYLAKHGWVRGGTVAQEVQLTGGNDHYLTYVHSGKLTPPKHTVAQLKQAGITTYVSDSAKATLYEFQLAKNDSSLSEWWLGFQNFYTITRYNHSPLYAMAVYQLADNIRKRR